MATEQDVQAVLDRLEEMPAAADVNAVVGEAVATGGRTLIPLSEVTHTFGASVGGPVDPRKAADESETPYQHSATHVRPLAVIEVTPTTIRIRSAADRQRTVRGWLLTAGWLALWTAALVKVLARRR